MSDVAPLLQGFFTDKLMHHLQASPHTIAAYRDTFTLLLVFVEQRRGHRPDHLCLADLDAPTIGAFLQHVEITRGNTVATQRASGRHSLVLPLCPPPGSRPGGGDPTRPGDPDEAG